LFWFPPRSRPWGEHRARLDASARDGVPAHLTVLYPFLPAGLIDNAVLALLAGLFAGVRAFRFTLDRVDWFGDDVVWLGPHDEAPFRHRLPFEAAATEVTLMTGPPPGNLDIPPGQWRTMAAFGFGRPGHLPASKG
jgi:hypothetical protein